MSEDCIITECAYKIGVTYCLPLNVAGWLRDTRAVGRTNLADLAGNVWSVTLFAGIELIVAAGWSWTVIGAITEVLSCPALAVATPCADAVERHVETLIARIGLYKWNRDQS